MLGYRIKQARSRIGMTTEQVASIIGVTRSAVSLWETNRTKPSHDNLKALAKALNVPAGYLLEEEPAA